MQTSSRGQPRRLRLLLQRRLRLRRLVRPQLPLVRQLQQALQRVRLQVRLLRLHKSKP